MPTAIVVIQIPLLLNEPIIPFAIPANSVLRVICSPLSNELYNMIVLIVVIIGVAYDE